MIHACVPGTDQQFPYDLAFYSLANPVHPRFISSYVPTSAAGLAVKPHEMYLWQDPKRPHRALLWISTPELTSDPAVPNMMIVDISKVADGGPVTELAEGNWNQLYEHGGSETFFQNDLYVHSMAPTADGRTTYLSLEGGEMLALDTRAVADDTSPGRIINLNNDLITNPASRPMWGNPFPHCLKACPEGHSSVPVPGRPYVLTTDEVYGTFTDPTFGCPWGWVHLINVRDPAHPVIVGEYKITQDTQAFCGSPADDPLTEQFTSYSSHNPTVLPDLAFITWHSGGLQAIDIVGPADPHRAGSGGIRTAGPTGMSPSDPGRTTWPSWCPKRSRPPMTRRRHSCGWSGTWNRARSPRCARPWTPPSRKTGRGEARYRRSSAGIRCRDGRRGQSVAAARVMAAARATDRHRGVAGGHAVRGRLGSGGRADPCRPLHPAQRGSGGAAGLPGTDAGAVRRLGRGRGRRRRGRAGAGGPGPHRMVHGRGDDGCPALPGTSR